MEIIQLNPIPNQSQTVNLGGAQWDIEIMDFGSGLAITISRDNIELVSGYRVMINRPLIPYKYLAATSFIWYSQENELPDFEAIGTTQFLMYATDEELANVV